MNTCHGLVLKKRCMTASHYFELKTCIMSSKIHGLVNYHNKIILSTNFVTKASSKKAGSYNKKTTISFSSDVDSSKIAFSINHNGVWQLHTHYWL